MSTALTKKALLSLLAASAVAISTPTLAQSYGGHGGGYGGGYGGGGWNGSLNGEQAQLSQRIDRAAYRGTISRREAQDLRHQLSEYERLEWRYRRDGLSRWERNDLSQRLDRIRWQLREDRRDGGRRDRW
jgi:hypothetical protein